MTYTPLGPTDRSARVKELEEEIKQLTVGDVGQMNAIRLEFYIRDGLDERHVPEVEGILSQARLEQAVSDETRD